jgi:hypothetical protein
MIVYVTSVGFFRNVRMNFMHDRRAHQLVALSGSKEQFADLFEIIVPTGHRLKATVLDDPRNAPDAAATPAGNGSAPVAARSGR